MGWGRLRDKQTGESDVGRRLAAVMLLARALPECHKGSLSPTTESSLSQGGERPGLLFPHNPLPPGVRLRPLKGRKEL